MQLSLLLDEQLDLRDLRIEVKLMLAHELALPHQSLRLAGQPLGRDRPDWRALGGGFSSRGRQPIGRLLDKLASRNLAPAGLLELIADPLQLLLRVRFGPTAQG